MLYNVRKAVYFSLRNGEVDRMAINSQRNFPRKKYKSTNGIPLKRQIQLKLVFRFHRSKSAHQKG